MIVFDRKMGMRQFSSTALPFGKVVYAVKVELEVDLIILVSLNFLYRSISLPNIC
jgi:hypothetical protein